MTRRPPSSPLFPYTTLFRSEMELWIDPSYIRAGYSWSFPAREELRVGVGSFWPSDHVKEPTVRLARELQLEPVGYQDRKSTRLNSSHQIISYAVFCLKKKEC